MPFSRGTDFFAKLVGLPLASAAPEFRGVQKQLRSAVRLWNKPRPSYLDFLKIFI